MSRSESPPALALNHGLTFAELFTPEGLLKIDGLFLDRLRARDARAHDTLLGWRTGREQLAPLLVSELLLVCGPVLEEFIAGLFGIEQAIADLRRQHDGPRSGVSFQEIFRATPCPSAPSEKRGIRKFH